MISDTSSGDDEIAAKDLAQLGYRQELKRRRGLAHILFTIMAVPFGVGAPIATALIGGGPATMIWGYIMVAIFSQPLALSLAEICSKYPTSAGAYYWCFRLSSPRKRRLSSWINGWLTMVGVWTISLSVTFGTTQILIAGINIYYPEWVSKAWQTYLIFVAITVFATIIGIQFNSFLPTLDILSAVWTFLGIIVILICLSVKAAAGRRSAAFALGHFDPSPSGWTSGWAFFVGLLPVTYTFSAIGMIASMAEEVHNPTVQVPKAIVWSVPIGGVCGLVFLLPIVFTLPDISTLLSVATGQPLGLMFTLIMGSKGGGFGIWIIIFIIGIFCAISICCAASRATWSFARDKAIPFHNTFSKVNQTFDNVPINAYILSTAVQLLLGLINLGSTAAFNAFVGVAVMCLGASYAMPVALVLANGRKDMADAPFHLGRWGFAINAWAVVWVIFEIVLFSMPAVVPVTSTSMNYASVVFVGFALLSAIWYTINGRYHYDGPAVPEHTDQAFATSNSSNVIEEK
ncbi:amino acid transporter [Coprinopsis sp. MPI-PUGE-AT-0042]|nr:amino acid transporter [Coprinopsis sp. MPI-PUGE-AT-0042]